jgi:hypothetical protein
MTTATKCKHCGRIIARNIRGEWAIPSSKLPSTLCPDGIQHHEPDTESGDTTGIITGIAVGASIFDAGLI